MRNLLRTRKQRVRERSSHTQRIQKSRDNGSDGKVVVKFFVRVFGRVFEAIEKSRGSRGFATAGMAHKRHACEVHFAVERVAGSCVPFVPELEMF